MNQMTTPDIWRSVKEDFDEKLPRRNAIVVKEDDFGLTFAYPADFGSIGWLFDNRDKTTYDESPVASIRFGEYSYPAGNDKRAAKNAFYFGRMEYLPALVKREIIFSNIGLEIKERFAQSPKGGFVWALNLGGRNQPCYPFEKKLYTVISLNRTDTKVKYRAAGNVLEMEVGNGKLFLASDFDNLGVYRTVDDYLTDLEDGVLTGGRTQGKYVLLEYRTKLGYQKRTNIVLGISFQSSRKAVGALREKEFEDKIRAKWNRWFFKLPKVNWASDRDKKACYKCWWVIKSNYYKHPRWGKTVIEALPVYRGFWQWSLPAVEWHSTLNPEIGSSFVKNLVNLFLNNQRTDGYVTAGIFVDETNPGERWSKLNSIQPPHFPWVALRYYRATRDIKSLRLWYPRLVKYYQYLNSSRDHGCLDLHLWAILNSNDSGLDTSPAFQRVAYGENGRRERFCYPAVLAAERCRYEQAMEKMAGILRNGDEAEWHEASRLTQEAMNRFLWNEKKSWYGVLHEDQKLDTRVGIDGLFPFAYGLVGKDKAAPAKRNFLKLLGDYGVFSVCPDEKGYDEEIYWRGPAWTKSCSVAMATAFNYYPGQMDKVKEGLVNFILKYPSLWECMSGKTGRIARGDMGLMAAPCVSSNVGAGEAIGAMLMFYGRDGFSF